MLSLMTNGAQSAGPAAATAALASGVSSESPDTSQNAADDDAMVREEAEGDESDVDQVANTLGVMKVEADKSNTYVGDSHWTSVLNEVSAPRRHQRLTFPWCLRTSVPQILTDDNSQIAGVREFFNKYKEQYDEQLEKVVEDKKDCSVSGFQLFSTPPPAKAEILAALPPRSIVDRLVQRYFNGDEFSMCERAPFRCMPEDAG